MCYAIVAVAHGPDLGLRRHPVARPRPVLRARRLRLRHVPDAPDRPRRQLRQATCRTSWCSSTGRNCPGSGPGSDSSSVGDAAGGGGARAARLVFGFFAFRSRIKGVYFSIITQALTFAAMLLFFRNETGFGGNNGFTDFKRILGVSITAPETRARAVRPPPRCCCCSRSWRPLHRPLQVRPGAGGDPRRGIARDVPRLRPGALQARGLDALGACCARSPARCTCRRSASSIPSEMSPANSIEIAIWVAVGGRGTLVGPIVGAFLVNLAKSCLHSDLSASTGCSSSAPCSSW